MRCPGQDMRYWKGGAAFEVACPKCGCLVEFFKDESSRRCRRCGHSFPNPKIIFDCAQWCEYAEDCVGPGTQSRQRALSPDAVFAARLLAAAEELLAHQETAAPLPLLIFQHARQLVSDEQCDPRKVLAAAIVIEIETVWSGARASAPAEAQPTPIGEHAVAGQLLSQLGLQEAEIQGVCEVIRGFRNGAASGDIEARIVCDAATLAQLAEAASRPEIAQLKADLIAEMKTQAGKLRAQALFGS